jgi:Flp pilus assembly protein TadG
MRCRRAKRRQGALVVESAVVLPLTFLLILGLIIGGVGCFRYNEMAHLARETARFASTHAGSYMSENSKAITNGTLPKVDYNYLKNNIAFAEAAGLNTANLTVTVKIITPSGTYNWDDTTSNKNRQTVTTVTNPNTKTSQNVSNMVQVTVSYKWMPELYLAGPITLSSTAVQALAY